MPSIPRNGICRAGCGCSKSIDIGAYETPLPEGPAADAYEPDDSAAAAKTIANGQTQVRNIHAAGNVDWVIQHQAGLFERSPHRIAARITALQGAPVLVDAQLDRDGGIEHGFA